MLGELILVGIFIVVCSLAIRIVLKLPVGTFSKKKDSKKK